MSGICEGSIVYKKAYKFSVDLIKEYKKLFNKEIYEIAKQMLKSGTSIGANICEANGAISTAEFSMKISIAYKEALETRYWLSLLKDTHYLEPKCYEILDH